MIIFCRQYYLRRWSYRCLRNQSVAPSLVWNLVRLTWIQSRLALRTFRKESMNCLILWDGLSPR